MEFLEDVLFFIETEKDFLLDALVKANATDPFRIVKDKQVRVYIKLKVGGYNELIEGFPMTQTYL